jgi:hypothetical protein
MSSVLLRRSAMASLLGFLTITAGCGASPTAPVPVTNSGLAASPGPATSPSHGLLGDVVRVFGEGFLPGATVTFDGLAARIIGTTSTIITVAIPAHSPGVVDIVVTNPGGATLTVTGAFTYDSVLLTASPSVVRIGGQLDVEWLAPAGRGCLGGGDWIAVYKVGDPDKTGAANGHSDLWYDHVCGVAHDHFTLPAPLQPGNYEFRYLVGDTAVARSNPVEVSNN